MERLPDRLAEGKRTFQAEAAGSPRRITRLPGPRPCTDGPGSAGRPAKFPSYPAYGGRGYRSEERIAEEANFGKKLGWGDGYGY